MILLSSTGESIFQLIVVLVCFVIVLAMTYFTTRWIAGYQKTQSINKNLAVSETLKLTTDKYVQLIQVGKDRYFVIAVGKNEITFLGEISQDELKEIPDTSKENIPTIQGDFNDILNKFKNHKTDK
ncbi:MAG: flagellar biosynthetic protein FliO [Lachnospiraceae bacterium]|jgi:flagellar protein FliO/FliZ|nr:flagellar biosynthetic protein FliO [Lachnospiraceae bacterium]MBQ2088675.1 flagellar biosynthetic protein FliO [Lachnospiraceae bacterium]MBQ4300938.1 flagellar biosynthetic protein FliO [Lachnospiraceae bacterium]MCR5355677.1 flagellar biosynthetic protein FliO [Lachnospiraceae bacterium]